MQPQESFSVPRRSLDLEDYIDVARRHRSWILGPAFIALVATVVGVYLWPDTYVSKASVKVVPQIMPDSLVPSNINQQMDARIGSMANNILSRNVLTQIINQYSLYPRERSRMPIDDVVQKMHDHIKLSPVQTLGAAPERIASAFSISFEYENRFLAQKVVQNLASQFIDQNTRDRAAAAVSTTNFLQDQLSDAKKDLDRLDTQLADFRSKNQGRLPDEVNTSYQQLNILAQQLQQLNNNVSQDNQQKLLMESELRNYRDQLAQLQQPSAQPVFKSQHVLDLEHQLQELDNSILQMRQQFTDKYPGLEQAMRARAALQKEHDDAVKATPAQTEPSQAQVAISRQTDAMNLAIRRMQAQVEAKDLELQQDNKQIAAVNASIKNVQTRLEGVPMSEKEYSELMGERDLAKQKYDNYAAKVERSQLAEDMENRSQGETLQQLDPASLPEDPVSPQRPIDILVGTGLGIVLGIVLAGVREMKDTSLKNLKDARAYTKLAILGSVPLLENDLVVRRRRRIAWLAWSSACLIGIGIMSTTIVYYYATKL